MFFQVVKGQKIDLTTSNPDLKVISVYFDWKAYHSIEIDPSAFLLNAHGKVNREEDLIFYNNPDGIFITLQDSMFNDFKKQFIIQLEQVPSYIERIAFTLTLYENEPSRNTFSLISKNLITLMNHESGKVIAEYDVGSDFPVETAIVACELYRYKGLWKFNAIAAGFSGGLAALCTHYGIETTD